MISTLPPTTLAFWTPGPMEMAIIGVLGLLFFGKRLPEVGRSLGRGIVEFKRGLKGVGDDIEAESDRPALPRTAFESEAKHLPGPATSATSPASPAPAEARTTSTQA